MENTYDITLLLLALIAFVLWVLKILVWPWFSQVVMKKLPAGSLEILKTAARIGVFAAESIWGRGFGEDKLKDALLRVKQYLANLGIVFDEGQILAAINAEWQELDLEQRKAGIK